VYREHIGKFSSEYDKYWRKFVEYNTGKKFTVEELLEKAAEYEKDAMKVAKDYEEAKKLKKP
jgi:hypothetical protein